MKVKYNGCFIKTSHATVGEFLLEHDSEADIIIVNGFHASKEKHIKERDEIILIKRGRIPRKNELEYLMASRHTPEVHEKMKTACVGIAGVGGLGSNACIALARMGVGTIVIADFDIVEPSNLNRQAYFIEHLGQNKVDAMASLIKKINPYITVITHHIKVDESNIAHIFGECDVVIEAFDNPENKALIVSVLLTTCNMPIIAGSGMAGVLSSNTIKTLQKFDRLYVVGDLESEAEENMGLMAPRVLVASAHQANMAVRLILGQTNP